MLSAYKVNVLFTVVICFGSDVMNVCDDLVCSFKFKYIYFIGKYNVKYSKIIQL